tara:strand:+ start:19219 stop:20124 length:906 start_codon:yes stop_codon:yes gene_type:complete
MPKEAGPSFKFKSIEQGVELLEDNQPVFFYQKSPKSPDGEYVYNNYLHPLYDLKGETLTEEFPIDHPYHRGVFWAWHQIFINGKNVGDGWIMKNITTEVISVKTEVKRKNAQLKLNVFWKSPSFNNNSTFLEENTTIIVHKIHNGIREIDINIGLKALVPGVEIGGADDEKGYGGLCVRLKTPMDLKFTSAIGPLLPKTEQIEAGSWMDFTGSFSGNGKKSGISIHTHPKTPNYPAPWILRSESSMQNIVFPGRHKIPLPIDKALNLHYRLIVHPGNDNKINFPKLQLEYELYKVPHQKKI